MIIRKTITAKRRNDFVWKRRFLGVAPKNTARRTERVQITTIWFLIIPVYKSMKFLNADVV